MPHPSNVWPSGIRSTHREKINRHSCPAKRPWARIAAGATSRQADRDDIWQTFHHFDEPFAAAHCSGADQTYHRLYKGVGRAGQNALILRAKVIMAWAVSVFAFGQAG